ncbi:hypothetical protein Asp14428_03100 [Actinoplanes sp. NBRC 14428]|nr:hypothetical protein Asp14428_03100 [Actinoplanes sp. NBRC 14428]
MPASDPARPSVTPGPISTMPTAVGDGSGVVTSSVATESAEGSGPVSSAVGSGSISSAVGSASPSPAVAAGLSSARASSSRGTTSAAATAVPPISRTTSSSRPGPRRTRGTTAGAGAQWLAGCGDGSGAVSASSSGAAGGSTTGRGAAGGTAGVPRGPVHTSHDAAPSAFRSPHCPQVHI